jgi:hypothetical protein
MRATNDNATLLPKVAAGASPFCIEAIVRLLLYDGA